MICAYPPIKLYLLFCKCIFTFTSVVAISNFFRCHLRHSTMSSSMRNAIPRRSHRERPQPLSRARKGLLEKRKDYLQRAKSHQAQSRTLKRLVEKASERNPDEFYFGMVRGRTRDGVRVTEREESRSLGVMEIRPLKVKVVKLIRNVVWIEAGKGRRMSDE